LDRNRFKDALYNGKTKWPGGGHAPADAINTDKMWAERLKELRHEQQSGE
jgi:hypothetical protein